MVEKDRRGRVFIQFMRVGRYLYRPLHCRLFLKSFQRYSTTEVSRNFASTGESLGRKQVVVPKRG